MDEIVVRGKLKIYFGAFTGAGKTGAMLRAAQRMQQSGCDVVLGALDLHGKDSDRPLAATFEALPGFERGLSLDAALARHPNVLLVDELASSNPPGSRHPKRWNDVEELLANGIDVFTTMSVQHLESLNDVVADVTGISEPETVPDTFFDTADETIMVDMSADELLARLKEGSVAVGHVNAGPGGRFFQKGSLLALRELALRRVADVVEDEVQRYRAEKAITATWKTHGRMLVCVGPSPGAEHTVRSAARLAGQLDEEWTAAYVETPSLQRLPASERARILQVLSLAEELGATTVVLTGNNVPDAVTEYARDRNISTIVVGRPLQRPFVFTQHMAESIAKAGDDLDIVEIGRGAEAGTPVTTREHRARADAQRRGEKRLRYVWTALGCLGATVALATLAANFDLANVAMLYMLVVLLAGVRFGRGPAIFATILNVVAFDFFFVPPKFAFLPEDIQHYLTYAVMLAAGVITA
jgi:two-component system, OmpR family, sensor histidine kinase KdpD